MPSTTTLHIVGLLSNGANPIQKAIVTMAVAITAGYPYFINPDNTPSNCKPNHQSLMKNLLHIQHIAKANKKFNINVM